MIAQGEKEGYNEKSTGWKRDIGYFERTEDMVFALERRKCGKSGNRCQ